MTSALTSQPIVEAWVLSLVLIIARVSSFVMWLPVFGGREVPQIVKASLSLMLAAVWFTEFGSSPSATVWAVVNQGHWLGYAQAVGKEMLFGALMGYALGLLLLPARVAGTYIGQEMGLTLATLSDPSTGASVNVVAQVFETMAILVFFAFDVHHFLLGALHASFSKWQVGSPFSSYPASALAASLSTMHEGGLLIAAPVGICLFVTIVGLGLLMRAAPQFNLFSIGFTVRIVVGMVAILFFLPEILSYIARYLQGGMALLHWMIT